MIRDECGIVLADGAPQRPDPVLDGALDTDALDKDGCIGSGFISQWKSLFIALLFWWETFGLSFSPAITTPHSLFLPESNVSLMFRLVQETVLISESTKRESAPFLFLVM